MSGIIEFVEQFVGFFRIVGLVQTNVLGTFLWAAFRIGTLDQVRFLKQTRGTFQVLTICLGRVNR